MSSFGFESTTDEVLAGLDLTGVEVLITGTSAGLGVETARSLAARGANVSGVVRDPDKARRSLAAAGATDVELHQADLSSFESIRAFSDGFSADGPGRLDVLIANAGIMACPHGTTVDGHELQFGTNHLGHFLLVNRLVPLLLAGAPARVVMVSSSGHSHSDVSLDDPGFDHTTYDPWAAYGRAKTANVLFAVELDRRLRDRGVRATALHPGAILTDLGRHLTEESLGALVESQGDREIVFKSVPQGAATTVWAGFVADPDEVGGRYCEDCAVAPACSGELTSPGVLDYALDADTAARLWTLSEQMVGEEFSA